MTVPQPLLASANRLEELLVRYARLDNQARALYESLQGIIQSVKDGSVELPMSFDDVPGEYWFDEGQLSKYPELEDAYSKFKIQVTDDDPDLTDELLDSIDNL